MNVGLKEKNIIQTKTRIPEDEEGGTWVCGGGVALRPPIILEEQSRVGQLLISLLEHQNSPKNFKRRKTHCE